MKLMITKDLKKTARKGRNTILEKKIPGSSRDSNLGPCVTDIPLYNQCTSIGTAVGERPQG